MYAVSVHTLRTDGVCGALQVGCHARVADPRACVFAVLVVAVVFVGVLGAGKVGGLGCIAALAAGCPWLASSCAVSADAARTTPVAYTAGRAVVAFAPSTAVVAFATLCTPVRTGFEPTLAAAPVPDAVICTGVPGTFRPTRSTFAPLSALVACASSPTAGASAEACTVTA